MPCNVFRAEAWKKRTSTMKTEAERSSESGPGYLSRYSDSLRARRSGDRIPVGSEIFRIRPDQPWGPPCLLYNGYRVSFPGVKRLGHGDDHPTPSSAEVKERVELYLYSPSGPLWPVLGWTLRSPEMSKSFWVHGVRSQGAVIHISLSLPSARG